MARPAKTKQPTARRSAVPNRPWQLLSTSHRHTDRLGQAIGRALRGGETIALYGPLGAGKTALVRGIAQGLGASPAAISSPTFVMIHEYDQGRLPLAHVDLYRIRSPRELESIGLTEYFSGRTVTAIEWADKGLAALPQDRIEITLNHRAAQSRAIQFRATGPKSDEVISRARIQHGKTGKVHRAPPRRDVKREAPTRS
ncbi:MAG: tRNA (adenosine(37)-N6)-threonylcarbamoyltransferase complex ATPase subunit type 1 TsaE [Nitrospirota bacterium]|jgi:tRNA threonylcarbamoyladenosine biosynthesis protein TsaE